MGDYAVDRAIRAVVAFDALGHPEGAACPLPRCEAPPSWAPCARAPLMHARERMGEETVHC